MSHSQKTYYIDVPEGAGNTYDFNNIPPALPQNTQHILTSGCHTCVGVYFKIDNERCFCAHINAMFAPGKVRFVKTQEDADKIKRIVRGKLERESSASNWTAAEVRQRAGFPDTVVLVCPMLYSNDERWKQTGYYVVEAIKEFLELDADFPVDSESQGFLVHHASGQVKKIPNGGVDHAEKLKSFLAANNLRKANLNLDSWTIALDSVEYA
ncbi:Hypothetical predicted protein [Lecanosticta acicola]|uniref:Uncharacterized protein n=1 Tax=Lecanosticta acicola TaxID=111012 RepID=A0AAI8YWN8_9PEZI|nr:Hypothetical predicted protein [Lecanosticta acicola]